MEVIDELREGRDQAAVSVKLGGVSIAALDRAVLRSAGFLPMPYLRTLDALHMEAAIRLEAEAVLTYDRRLAEGAKACRGRDRCRNDSDRVWRLTALNMTRPMTWFRAVLGLVAFVFTGCASVLVSR